MIKIPQVKCPECEKMNNKEDAIKYKNRYYCSDCLEKKKEQVSKNTDGWEGLYEYMKELYGKVDGKMFSLIAKYRKEPYNYINEGMRLTLYYYHELLENPVNEDAIGLIPYYYEKAKQEYIINMDIRKYNTAIELKNSIKRIQVKPVKSTLIRRKNIIDLDTLGVNKYEQ